MFRFLAICAGVFATIVIVTVAAFAWRYHKMGQAMQADLEAAYAELQAVNDEIGHNIRASEPITSEQFETWLETLEAFATDGPPLRDAMARRMQTSEETKFLDVVDMANELNTMVIERLRRRAEVLGRGRFSEYDQIKVSGRVMQALLDVNEATSPGLARLRASLAEGMQAIETQTDVRFQALLEPLDEQTPPDSLPALRALVGGQPDRVMRLIPFMLDEVFLSNMGEHAIMGQARNLTQPQP